MKTMTRFILAVITVMLSACGSMNLASLDAGNVGQTATVRDGLVLSVATVMVKPQQNYSTAALGGSLGGTIGAGIGSRVGNGKGRALATILGGVLGTAAGTTAMQTGTDTGKQYILNVDNQRMAVVLTNFDPSIRPGDRVLLIYHGSRVTRIQKA